MCFLSCLGNCSTNFRWSQLFKFSSLWTSLCFVLPVFLQEVTWCSYWSEHKGCRPCKCSKREGVDHLWKKHHPYIFQEKLPKAVQQLKNVCSWEQSEIEVDASCSLSHIHIHTRRAVLSTMAVHKKAKQWRFVLPAGPAMTQTSNSTAHSPAVISRKSVEFNWNLHILFKPGLPEFHKYLEMHVTARHCPIWNLTVLKNNNSPDTNIFMQKNKTKQQRNNVSWVLRPEAGFLQRALHSS